MRTWLRSVECCRRNVVLRTRWLGRVHRFRYKTLREEESHWEDMDGSFIDNVHPHMHAYRIG